MRGLLIIFAVIGAAVCFGGFATMGSDIQIIIGLVGGFSAVILVGLASVLTRIERLESRSNAAGKVRVTEGELP